MERKVAAACVQMDSWQLLAMNVAHLITQGVQDFFIMNHYCKADFRGNLENIFGSQARFRWFTKSTQPFYQSAMTTFLAQEAKREGFDALVVFDADEFFTAKQGERTLAEAIFVEMGTYSHLKIEVQDFMVERVHECFSLRSLSEAQPNPKQSVKARRGSTHFHFAPSISLKQLGKVIINLKNWRPKQFVPTGNHYGSGLGKKSRQMTLLHLPFWSRGAIKQRIDHHQNLKATPNTSGIGIHLAHFVNVETETLWSSRTWARDPIVLSGNFVPDPSPTEFSAISARIRFMFPNLEESSKLFLDPTPTNSAAPDLSPELDGNGPRFLYQDGKTVTAKTVRLLRNIARVEVNLSTGQARQ
jgi:hypothetical protein